jgi:hypothetical protein
MNFVRVLAFLFLQQILSGCFMHSKISSLDGATDLPNKSLNNIGGIENFSGSNNYMVTAASGFRVKLSAGMIMNKQLAATQNGYRVYLHVNGRITSSEANNE